MDKRQARYIKLICETMARGGDTNSLRDRKDFAVLHRSALAALEESPKPVPETNRHLTLVDDIFGKAKKSPMRDGV